MSGRSRLCPELPEDLADEARDAVVHLLGPPLHLNVTSLVERALRRELPILRKKYNRGRRFPKRSVLLRTGPLPR